MQLYETQRLDLKNMEHKPPPAGANERMKLNQLREHKACTDELFLFFRSDRRTSTWIF